MKQTEDVTTLDLFGWIDLDEVQEVHDQDDDQDEQSGDLDE